MPADWETRLIRVERGLQALVDATEETRRQIIQLFQDVEQYLLLITPPPASMCHGSLTVTVTNQATGVPVEGVLVEITQGAYTFSGFTDSSGVVVVSFAVAGTAGGDWDITASKTRWATQTVTETAVPCADTAVAIHLVPATGYVAPPTCSPASAFPTDLTLTDPGGATLVVSYQAGSGTWQGCDTPSVECNSLFLCVQSTDSAALKYTLSLTLVSSVPTWTGSVSAYVYDCSGVNGAPNRPIPGSTFSGLTLTDPSPGFDAVAPLGSGSTATDACDEPLSISFSVASDYAATSPQTWTVTE